MDFRFSTVVGEFLASGVFILEFIVGLTNTTHWLSNVTSLWICGWFS